MSNKEKATPSPFVLHSNISGKERLSIMKEDLDKLTDDDWAELKRRNVHICIIDVSEELKRKAIHPTIEELKAMIKENLEKNSSTGDILHNDLIPFV